MNRLVVLLVVTLACGGHVAGDDGGARVDGGDASANCTNNGVRLCGGVCGAAASCPGGCNPFVTAEGTDSPFGICFSDLADKGATHCALCGAGEGCVERSAGQFVCVPLSVCAALQELGATDVCWYGDKTPFDGRAIPTATGCPDPSAAKDVLCGGDCKPCNTQIALDRCIGQAPDHPFGVCAIFEGLGNTSDPSQFPICAMNAHDYLVPCPESSAACLIYPSPPADAAIAALNGFCMEADLCKSAAASIGVNCFDSIGNLILP